ncbi:MAG: hypothetical protein ACI4AL_04055 [Aristaeellaceae bacterium]
MTVLRIVFGNLHVVQFPYIVAIQMPNPNYIYDQWAIWRKQHGIKSSLHELRHTFISLNKADLPLELMKSVVGHSSSMDTFGVYGHEIEGERHRAAQIIDGVFQSVFKNGMPQNFKRFE